MAIENIVYPIGVSILGGIASAVYGSYRATSNGEDFDKRKFVMSIPKSIVGGVIALGASVITPELTNVATLTGFLSVFGIGFMFNEIIKGKPPASQIQPPQ